MNRGLIRLLTLWLVGAIGVMAAAGSATAAATGNPSFSSGSICRASADHGETYAMLAAHPGRWNCSPSGWTVKSERSLLRFDLRARTDRPSQFTTRLTRFAAMRITVIGANGAEARRELTEADMTPATSDWLMSTALPKVAGPIDAVIIEVTEPRHAGILSYGALTTPAENALALRHELLIAGLCGMLCMPMLFNFAFFRVLRERFLLWHLLATVFMLTHTAITSGLINRFASLTLAQLSIASSLSVAAGIAAASAFSADLIEPGKLRPIQRRLLRGVGFWVAPWTLFYLFAGGELRPYAAPVYLASLLPPMGLFVWVMTTALRRHSRAVIYQAAAWIPVMITALIRILSALGFTDAPIEMLVAQHYALGLEVVITSLGVFDRLLAIRHERDLAVADLRIVEARSERDPLTGLLNRQGLEMRFETLRAEGYRAMAVIDLDKFKAVNDTYGHLIGDTVLRAAADALEPDDDTRAIRMGGEEFLLLLRGGDVVNRAERRRQAIATRIATNVPGLDRVVTASMGLVELPAEGLLRADFGSLYAHCDRLLYEAKHTGRNRTMREKLQSFRPTPISDAA
jgi:diguanylate cyclase (GGDEF)-like protein